MLGVTEVTRTDKFIGDGYGYRNKEYWEDMVVIQLCEDEAAEAAGKVGLAAWRALRCRDGGRVDIRNDADGKPSFIEANPLAGIRPDYSDLCYIANFKKVSYQALIGKIMDSFLQRHPELKQRHRAVAWEQKHLASLSAHSDVAPDAPPDELDTLWQADEITAALQDRGHVVSRSPWIKDAEDAWRTDRGAHAGSRVQPGRGHRRLRPARGRSAPRPRQVRGSLYRCGLRGTQNAGNKPVAKGLLRDAGLPLRPIKQAATGGAVPPDWKDLHNGTRMIVKSALEDCSLGLDDGAIVSGLDAIRARHAFCTQKFGGQWFAEAYIEGREFNVAVIPDENGEPHVLPLAEMMFHEWQPDRPRIVGWQAKWDDDSFESTRTQREFGADENEPELAKQIHTLAKGAWKSVGLTSYARVDIRVDEMNRPTVLELNPNPCLSPDAGFAAAAERVGMNYADLMERILFAALA